MRILHVITSVAPRHGGPTEAVLSMVRALRSEGVDASILCSNDDMGGTLNVPLNQWVDHEGLPCWFIPRVPARQHTLVGFNYAPGFSPWLREHVRDFDFIHVHTVFSHPANVAMGIARNAGIPYAVRPMGHLCRWSMRQRGWIKRLQLALTTRRNIDGAAFIHTTSSMEAEETAELGFLSRCLVLPHGLHLPPEINDAREKLRVELEVPQELPLLVFMSRFHPKKGIELLLEACRELTMNFKLVLAGAGDDAYVATLNERIAGLGLEPHVLWYGFAEGERKWQLLQGADVFVLPSYSENFGIAVLEALACGLPVVISDQVALAESVKEQHLGCVVPTDVVAISAAIHQLLSSPAERMQIGQRARQVAREHFSWPAAARRLITAYEEAILKR
jgi:glycosyltransferase involved in cell wall biosynthesis